MTPPPHTARRALRAFAPALALAAAGLTVACADGPTAPAAAPSLATTTTTGTTGTGTAVYALKWNSSVTQASVSKVIGAAGGTLTLTGGATLVVPKGAVSTNTTFTITRLPGKIVAYDFQPHGATFAAALTVRQPGAGTNLASVAPTALQGAYFADQAKLDQTLGEALVSEFAPSTSVASDKSSVSFTVKHFSGYLMSTGRKGN